MVKKIDDPEQDDLAPDHLGWALWQCLAAWKRRFRNEMREAGYPAFAEARGSLLMHIGPSGIAQAELVARTGLTKQAVQQSLEILEAEGLVHRAPDPRDARRRHVVRSDAGRDAFAVSAAVKRRIDRDIAAMIGEEELATLSTNLNAMHSCLAEGQKNR